MTKKFWKDNRGQMIYAVVVAIMFLSVLSMIAMGLSLQHYHAAVQKQENIVDYYAADAVAELVRKRLGGFEVAELQSDSESEEKTPYEEEFDDVYALAVTEWQAKVSAPTIVEEVPTYTITRGSVKIVVGIQNNEFTSWEVSYNASND